MTVTKAQKFTAVRLPFHKLYLSNASFQTAASFLLVTSIIKGFDCKSKPNEIFYFAPCISRCIALSYLAGLRFEIQTFHT